MVRRGSRVRHQVDAARLLVGLGAQDVAQRVRLQAGGRRVRPRAIDVAVAAACAALRLVLHGRVHVRLRRQRCSRRLRAETGVSPMKVTVARSCSAACASAL